MTSHAVAEAGIERYEMFINGEFVAGSASTKMTAVVNPATEEVIGEVPNGTAADVDAAVGSAEKAQRSWSRLPAIKRAGYLREIAQAIRKNKDALARVISS